MSRPSLQCGDRFRFRHISARYRPEKSIKREISGFTLIELSLYVAILSLIATVAVPAVRSTNLNSLDLAQAGTVDALRFAREQARRSGIHHGVSVDPATNTLRVFRLDDTPTPNSRIYDIYHPVAKNLYALELDQSPYLRVSIESVSAQALGSCDDLNHLSFDSNGTVRCSNPKTTRLKDGNIVLAIDDHRRTILIDSVTGRVTSQ